MNDKSAVTRRTVLKLAGAAWLTGTLGAAPAARPPRLGIVQYALGGHVRSSRPRGEGDLRNPLHFLETCHRFDAGGMQVPLGIRPEPELRRLRERAEQYGMHVEGIVNPPKDASDVARFEQEIRCATAAGARVARTVIIPGRRYEQFESLADFREHERRGRRALELAEPVVARHRFGLAVENHKDHRVDERIALYAVLGSEWIGACLDLGNNFALLEDPLAVAKALAPYALTVHIKDHQVHEYEAGFWINDVALGEGFMDLAGMVAAVRAVKPAITFNLESITRDAIAVPVLEPKYWATFPNVPGTDLARTLRTVRAHSTREPLPKISALAPNQQLAAERRLVQASLDYARRHLDL